MFLNTFIVHCRKDDIEVGSALYYQAKEDGVPLNITMCKCMIGKFDDLQVAVTI